MNELNHEAIQGHGLHIVCQIATEWYRNFETGNFEAHFLIEMENFHQCLDDS